MPWGTLIANILASWIYEIMEIIVIYEFNSQWIAKAIEIGFLGCLSTVSTMMSEIYNMANATPQSHKFPFAYIIFSLTVSLGGSLLISGFSS